MKRAPAVIVATALVSGAAAAGLLQNARTDSSTRTYLGYSSAASAQQRALEERFRGAVSTDRLAAFHAALTKQPHLSGTPGARIVADYLTKALADAGLDVEVFEYSAYLSLPRTIAVDLVAPAAQSL